ncbi:MAG: HD domain-containing phosphohydrolase [Sporolactobacillus sp.]
MKRTIAAKEIKEGVILAQDVFVNSTVLYHSGTYLTAQMAEDLLHKDIQKLDVLSGVLPPFESDGHALLSEHDKKLLTERFHNDMTQIADELRYGHILHSETSYKWLLRLYLRLFSSPSIRLLMDSMKQWDPHCYTHSIDVFVFCSLLSRRLDVNLPQGFIIGSLLHDIGKLCTPRDILLKTGKLTEREYQQITNHTIDGYHLLKKFGFNEEVCRIARSHHERLNGSGYPDRLSVSASDCDLDIIMIADVYSALTLNRSYRKPMHATKALEIILRDTFSRHLFDCDTCYRFIEFISIYPSATTVSLSDGRTGTVISTPKGSPILPQIQLDHSPCIVQLPKDLSITVASVSGWDIRQINRQEKQNWQNFIRYLIDGDSSAAMNCLEDLSDGKRVEDVYIDIFERALAAIAIGQKKGTFTVSDELIAQGTVITLLDWRLLHFAANVRSVMGRAIITNMSRVGEFVYSKMIDNLLKVNGWRTFLLPDVINPTQLEEIIDKKHCTYLCMPVTGPHHAPSIIQLLHKLLKQFPDLTIFIHGDCSDISAHCRHSRILISTDFSEFVANMTSCFPKNISEIL